MLGFAASHDRTGRDRQMTDTVISRESKRSVEEIGWALGTSIKIYAAESTHGYNY